MVETGRKCMATKKKVAKKAAKKKTAAKKATTKKAAAKKKPAKKAPAKKVAAKKTVAKKTTTKKKPAKKASAKKAVTKKASTKKAAAKKAPAKKAAVKKAPAKKAAAKKTAAKKAPAKKAPSKKPVVKKTAAQFSSQNIDVQPLYGEAYQFKKGEEYMNENQVQHFHNILNAWKADLMQEVDETVHHMQDEAANFPDPNDRASQETEFALELRSRDRGRKLVKKIDESISMLKKDDYGYCDICGVEIGVRRLEARPTANQCIDCKTLDEIKEKQMG